MLDNLICWFIGHAPSKPAGVTMDGSTVYHCPRCNRIYHVKDRI